MSLLSNLKKLAGESSVYGLSMVFGRMLGILLIPLYAKQFTTEEYGKSSLLISLFTVLSMFSVLALDSAAALNYYSEELKGEEKNKPIASWFWVQLMISLLFSALLLLFSTTLSYGFYENGNEDYLFIILALNLPLSVLPGILNNWFRFSRKPINAAMTTIFSTIILLSCNYFFIVKLSLGVSGIILAYTTSFLCISIVGIYFLKNIIAFRFFDKHLLRKMLKFSLPLVPAGLAYWALNSAGVFFLEKYSTKSEIGLYQMGLNFAQAMFLITGSFQMAWGPYAFSIQHQPDARITYSYVFKAYAILTSLLLVALSVFAKDLLYYFASAEYLASNIIITLLAFNLILLGLSYIANIGLSLCEMSKPYSFITILSSVITLALYFPLTKNYGKEGIVIASLIGQIIIPIYLFYKAQKIYKIPYSFIGSSILLIFALLISIYSWQLDVSMNFTDVAVKGIYILFFFAFILAVNYKYFIKLLNHIR